MENLEEYSKKMKILLEEKTELEEKIAQQSSSTIDTTIQNERKKQEVYQETINIQKKFLSDNSIIKTDKNKLSFENTNNAAKEASEYFKELLKNENSVITTTEKFDKSNNLESFTVNIQRANREVESLYYTLKNIGEKENPIYGFINTGAKLNDSGAIKQIKQIKNAFASFTENINQFKSKNNRKLSGLVEPLSDFESKLSRLKDGTSTIDDVRNSLHLLKAAASEIDAPLKRELNTFDKYKNAIEQGKESISGYHAELKGLTNAPQELNQELTKATKLLLEINKTEANEGTTVNWSNQARNFADLLTNIGNKLTVLKKEQSNSASTQIFNTTDLDKQGKIYIQKISNTIEKTKSEIESKLRNAGYMDIEIKGIEEANGKIESLTVNVTDAIGVFKQLSFERAKIQNQGKAQSGLIQTNDVKVIGNLSSSIHTVQTNLSSLKNKWQEQNILIGEFRTKIEQLESSLSSVNSKNKLNNLKIQIQALKNEASTILKANKIQLSIDTGSYDSTVESLINRTNQ